ncbi:hypothetical protein [Microvirga yunnanensis]|uniref:hypothetical protein n=1 Tax=Microvirga yunnanensis TaxID=2953740 RepID=UPI0021C93285|nr:hypothetical protein [Microvirga sp. HBU65207]
MSSYTMTGCTRKPAACLASHPNAVHYSDLAEFPVSYAVHRIAHRCRISTAQSSVIVELLGLAPEVRHG